MRLQAPPVPAVTEVSVLSDGDMSELTRYPVVSPVHSSVQNYAGSHALTYINIEKIAQIPSRAVPLLRQGHAANRIVHDHIGMELLTEDRTQGDIFPPLNIGCVVHEPFLDVHEPGNSHSDPEELSPVLTVNKSTRLADFPLQAGEYGLAVGMDPLYHVFIDDPPGEGDSNDLEDMRYDIYSNCTAVIPVQLEQRGFSSPWIIVYADLHNKVFAEELLDQPLGGRNAELRNVGHLLSRYGRLNTDDVEEHLPVPRGIVYMTESRSFDSTTPFGLT